MSKRSIAYESRESALTVIGLFLLIVFLVPMVLGIMNLLSPDEFVTGNPGQENTSQVMLIGGCVVLVTTFFVSVLAAGMMKARLEMKEYKELILQDAPSEETAPKKSVSHVAPPSLSSYPSSSPSQAYTDLLNRKKAEQERNRQNAQRRQVRREREELEAIRNIKDDRERRDAYQKFHRERRERIMR